MTDQPKTTSPLAIQIQNVGKCFHLYDKPADRLKQFILPKIRRYMGLAPKQYFREFWALRDISFEVKRGEAVGIVGRNGAGKSTLLQVISGTLTPTSGNIEVNGSVAALLELGSGFNPEFSGRENVYLTASVLGLTKEETDNRFDEITAFADIGEFIDQPLSTYSSGMMMRLAFAVNTCVDPDILIVDEALGVGDAPFQAKCYKRLRELADTGTSLLFVSHDIETVRSICTRAIWLKSGLVESWGEAKSIVKKYERYCWAEQGIEIPSIENPNTTEGDCSDPISVERLPYLYSQNKNRMEKSSRSGTLAVKIEDFCITDSADVEIMSCDYDQKIVLKYIVKLNESIDSDFVLGVRVKDLKGSFIYSANDLSIVHHLNGASGDTFLITAELKMPLSNQDYVILTGIFGFSDGSAYTKGVYDFSKAVIWDLIDDAGYISVRSHQFMPIAGPVHSTLDISVSKIH